MKKITRTKICNWTLAALLPLVLASSIQLEVTASTGLWPILIHVFVATVFMSFIVWHIYLHFKWQKWIFKFSKLKVATRILWWLYVITLFTGVATLIHWEVTQSHGPLGGIHGKIGFIMLAFAIGHTCLRIRFFKK